MQILKQDTHINFLGMRKVAMLLSLTLIVISIASIAMRGFNFGIDFTGGTLIEVGYPQNVELNQVRQTLADSGYGDAVVQHFGTATDVLIRLAPREGVSSAELSDKVLASLKGANAEAAMRRVEFVGPQVGEELTNDGGLAMIYALIGILIYVALRFEYRFAVGSVAALVHDVIITLGVIGYSLNDTIVVFDRIRENFRMMRKGTPEDVVNASLNQTLSRTLMTSFTTMLVLFALFFFGGELIHGFATALLVGIFVGTYSSIYVASASALALGVSKEDLMPVEKEGANLDDMP